MFDKEVDVHFCSELLYAGLWLAEHCVQWFSGVGEQIEGVN